MASASSRLMNIHRILCYLPSAAAKAAQSRTQRIAQLKEKLESVRKLIHKRRPSSVRPLSHIHLFGRAAPPAAWLALKRIGWYLIGARRILQTFKWCEISGHIEGYRDSDWAGDRVSRRSTSGGALIWNGDVLKTWSVRQKTIALSSAEAELYAMTKCATQTLGMIQLMQDFNIVLKGVDS